ncbi:MAG: RNA polymerase sigma factor RpoD/SigA [bacterium]
MKESINHNFFTEECEEDQCSENDSKVDLADTIDPLRIYFREINRYVMLTREEESLLAHRIKEGDPQARARMIKANLRLVVSIAKRYANKGQPLMDLIEEGNLGLIRAVEKYNPERGYRFSTYASWWIKQFILRSLLRQTDVIHLPINIAERINRYMRSLKKMVQKLGREPTLEEIKEEYGLFFEHIKGKGYIVPNFISINNSIEKNDGGGEREFTLKDESAESPIELLLQCKREEYVEYLLNSLKKQEKEIIIFRFGLNDSERKTLEDIGNIYGLTRERIRQIESNALKKMRFSLTNKNLTISELI